MEETKEDLKKGICKIFLSLGMEISSVLMSIWKRKRYRTKELLHRRSAVFDMSLLKFFYLYQPHQYEKIAQ